MRRMPAYRSRPRLRVRAPSRCVSRLAARRRLNPQAGRLRYYFQAMKTNMSRSTLTVAYAVAICADLMQICFIPLLPDGFLNPLDDFSDAIACIILIRLIGFHFAFLPSFLVKLVPFVEIVPTWTVAVFIATRNLRAPVAPVVDVPSEVKPEVVANRELPPKNFG